MQTLPIVKIEALAARRLNEQQIADVLDISLDELKKDRGKISLFREAIRKGRAKGEAELRGALYKRARNGDVYAYNELMRLSRSKDSD
ncbi:hypothetical protein GC087_14510 [Pantoea sp. JZ2]|uniref:hypothetical protein n=1 Tax=Pantoea sp. JZ2 TaxID=2654189 RepID=UPI002B493567|nr:hypothetical protein [Pantoea sp. JZ2]WRH13741.1 hypothetical protein GC087_14510 [Pantoea sp. JZ2]